MQGALRTKRQFISPRRTVATVSRLSILLHVDGSERPRDSAANGHYIRSTSQRSRLRVSQLELEHEDPRGRLHHGVDPRNFRETLSRQRDEGAEHGKMYRGVSAAGGAVTDEDVQNEAIAKSQQTLVLLQPPDGIFVQHDLLDCPTRKQ
jgi:hypothetical protein